MRLQYGLVLAGRVATGEPDTFEINEWSVAARGQLSLPEVLGLRAAASLGASAFVATPASGVTAQSPTLLATGFLELSLSRPIWFESFAIAPALGARLFSGTRQVRVNGQEFLAVPLITPQASLAAIGRFSL